MAKKTNTIVTPITSKLVKSRTEVSNLIEEQIKASEKLFDFVVDAKQGYVSVPFGTRRVRWIYDEKQKNSFFSAYHQWDDFNKEIFTRSFADSNNTDRAMYEHTGYVGIFTGDENIVEEQKRYIREKVAYMQGFLKRLPLIPCEIEEKQAVSKAEILPTDKIFLVHGHNNLMLESVARTIQQLHLQPIILREEEDFGKTIIEKFEKNASEANFAVILLSCDDMAVSKKNLEKENKEKEFKAQYLPRARQNVIYEMGYFTGMLDCNHVFLLVEDGVETPGDLDGIIYTSFTTSDWRFKLVKRLQACGYKVSADDIL